MATGARTNTAAMGVLGVTVFALLLASAQAQFYDEDARFDFRRETCGSTSCYDIIG